MDTIHDYSSFIIKYVISGKYTAAATKRTIAAIPNPVMYSASSFTVFSQNQLPTVTHKVPMNPLQLDHRGTIGGNSAARSIMPPSMVNSGALTSSEAIVINAHYAAAKASENSIILYALRNPKPDIFNVLPPLDSRRINSNWAS